MVKIINKNPESGKMCFEHNLNYVHNSSHLTRWVAPYSPVNLWYCADAPNKVSMG